MLSDQALPIAAATAVIVFAVYVIAWWLRDRALARAAAEKPAKPSPAASTNRTTPGNTKSFALVAPSATPLLSTAPVPPAPSPRSAPPAPISSSSSSSPAPPSKATPSSAPFVATAPPVGETGLVRIDYEEDAADGELTKVGVTAEERKKRTSTAPPTQKILYDEDAAVDEPTHAGALILVTATAQTDKGLRRKRNEDSVLSRVEDGIFVVADGMGGYRGGEIASSLAVSTIERAFVTQTFDGPLDDAIPRRASELVRAIQMANEAILERAESDNQLTGMGTTICAARFSANKQRLYVGHVGDSRVYCFRKGKLRQMTSDHTMKDFGITGEGAAHLSRAVGVWPVVPIDVVFGKPQPDDLYLLCSDGLTKMVSDDEIRVLLDASETPSVVAEALVKAANEKGGKDNVSVIVVRVDDPSTTRRPNVAA